MTSKERAYLAGLAMKIKPIFQIGKSSLTPEFAKSVNEALEVRELVKISVLNNCQDKPMEIADTLAERTNSQVVQVIGKKIILYRESKEKKRIEVSKEKKRARFPKEFPSERKRSEFPKERKFSKENSFSKDKFSKDKFSKENSFSKARDFKARDFKERDFKARDFKERDFKARDFKERDFKTRDFKERDFKARDSKERERRASGFSGKRSFVRRKSGF